MKYLRTGRRTVLFPLLSCIPLKKKKTWLSFGSKMDCNSPHCFYLWSHRPLSLPFFFCWWLSLKISIEVTEVWEVLMLFFFFRKCRIFVGGFFFFASVELTLCSVRSGWWKLFHIPKSGQHLSRKCILWFFVFFKVWRENCSDDLLNQINVLKST